MSLLSWQLSHLPPAQASNSCTVSPILVNSCRPWLGAAAENYPQAASGTESQVLYHEQRIGRQLDIVHTYHSVGQNSLTSADVYFATRPNTILLTDWNPTNNWADIASQNAAIDQMATSIAAVSPAKVMVALSHEPENNVSPGGDPNCPSLAYKGTDGTVADYRNMWAYVENRFAADGVTNVVWVMDYMNDPTWQCLVNDLYPGDNLVDWILFNAYGSGSSPNFDNVVSSFYNYLTANSDAAHDYLAHPWGIAEWGINGYTVAKEEAYYDQAKTALDGNMFPNLKAYVVFDENAEGSATGNSCRVGYDDNGTWDPTKASHYYAFADDPRFTNAYYTTPPSVPGGLAAVAAASGSEVDLSWNASTDNVGVAGYQVFRDGAPVANVTTGTSYADTGLSDGTSYQYTVAAYDAAGNVSAQSPAVTAVTPDVTPPSVPGGLAAAATSSGSEVDLSWNASTDNVGVAGYQVFRDGTPVAEVTSGTSYADTGLSDATSYQYTVAAYDAAGNVSAQSPAVTAVTPDVTPPSVPTGLELALAAKSISLSWAASTDNVGVTGYAIYRNGTKIATTTSLAYSNTSVAQGKTYTYSVAAYDAAGNQSAQSAAQVMTFPDTTPPSVPTALKLALAARSIKLSWAASTDNVGVTGYAIYRNGTKIATTTSLSYSDTTVVQGMTYIYSVAAYDAAGNQSAQSAAQVMTFPDTTPPSVPTGLTAAAAASGSQVNLSWTASTDNVAVAGYKVFRNGTQVAEVTSGTSYADTGLSEGTSYRYTVAAYDAAGNTSAQSHAVTAVTPDTIPPTEPTNLTLTPGSKSITLKWTASTDNVGVKGYYIYRDNTMIATVTATKYTDNKVTTGTTYSYYIVAFDAALNLSQPSATMSAAAK